MRLRLSNNISWAYEFEAADIEALKRNVRKGWERYIEEQGGWDLTNLGHPAIAYRARETQINDWLKERLGRDVEDKLKKEWERQAAHWIGRARRDFGEIARHLYLHVFHEPSGTWNTMGRWAAHACDAPGAVTRVPRIITGEEAVEILSVAQGAWEHANKIQTMINGVVEMAFPNKPEIRLVSNEDE